MQSQEPSEQMRLRVHEWLAIATFIGVLTVIASFASCPSTHLSMDTPHYLGSTEIEVFVEGAVEYPGIYRVTPGTVLKDVLSLAQPTISADLRRLKPDSKLRNGRIIKVPLKREKIKKPI